MGFGIFYRKFIDDTLLFMVSAKGAAFSLAWGSAPGIRAKPMVQR